ncbi:hypothetical protein [Nitrosomonas sp. Nm166]|uniref:hypothetical protein n=1 Tax=Nitrosomonas sp. Nm166 TaxID=1881054 RepID=UPI0008F2FE12|nr:hypothetical protein [Nitrosomonas sp. Nm166]SFF10143.1 hypothetical protein SAMN05428977_10508 [Nitrosomonas sp. Nm166]
MKDLKWLLIMTSFMALMQSNLALAEGDGGNGGDGGDSGGDMDGGDMDGGDMDGGDMDGGDHHDDDDDHHHHHHHDHFILGIGGYYDPWFWGGYYGPRWGGYYGPRWGGYYGPGVWGPYGYADPFIRPYYTYPSAITAPSRPPVYIQQQEPKPAEPKTSYWYYCQTPQGYYPYIKECPGGWLQVAPQPYAQ